MHDCYICGQACYCHGDIDDCPVETVEFAYEHCEGCGAADCRESDDIDDGHFDDDNVTYGPEPDYLHDEEAWLDDPR